MIMSKIVKYLQFIKENLEVKTEIEAIFNEFMSEHHLSNLTVLNGPDGRHASLSFGFLLVTMDTDISDYWKFQESIFLPNNGRNFDSTTYDVFHPNFVNEDLFNEIDDRMEDLGYDFYKVYVDRSEESQLMITFEFQIKRENETT